MRKSMLVGAALACALQGAAYAHVVFDDPRRVAGSDYRAVFRIVHGCSGSAVRAVEVEVPEGVRNARAMAKAGWTLSVEPARIRWSGGRVAKGEFDEFVVLARLPASPGTLYWKVAQICEQGRIDWADVPEAGKALSDYRAPAVLLEVLPAEHGKHSH